MFKLSFQELLFASLKEPRTGMLAWGAYLKSAPELAG